MLYYLVGQGSWKRGGGRMAQARWDMGALRPIDDLMFRVMARDKAFCGERSEEQL